MKHAVQQPRILAIDDTPANLQVLAAALTLDFNLQIATSGPVGLAAAGKAPPDLILLDVMMPGMDGFEVCRRLKADPVLQTIPVIFITATTDRNAEEMGLALGAVDYISKPIKVEIAKLRIRNLLEREVLRRQLERIAHYDVLTKLPNRALLSDRMNQAMTQAQRRNEKLAVVFLDLDGFKAVNDTHGHEVGDFLLVTVAERMQAVLRDSDTLARIGGDEFVTVLPDLATIANCAPVLTRLLQAAAQPVQFGQITLQVSASLGVTFYPQAQEMDADQLLRQADQAMYQAKQSGRNRFHVFDAVQDRSVRDHHENMQGIACALAQGEFALHYQPKVNMRTGAVRGAEALIRWVHPERGLLPPAHFLPMIEDHPLAVDLGQWVIQNALAQINQWQQAGLHLPISVNIGARHLKQANFVSRLRDDLAAYPQLKPGCLEVELLESSAMGDLDHVSSVIQECRELGVKFALDDFGIGYSTMTCLKKLPVAQLKIDQSFVREMRDNPNDRAIVSSMVGLARTFRIEVIAEGVETLEEGVALLDLGCELAQGYAIARPMPAAELPLWVRNWQPHALWREVALS